MFPEDKPSGFPPLRGTEHHHKDPYLVNVNGKWLSGCIPTKTHYVIYCVGPNLTIHHKRLIRELRSANGALTSIIRDGS